MSNATKFSLSLFLGVLVLMMVAMSWWLMGDEVGKYSFTKEGKETETILIENVPYVGTFNLIGDLVSAQPESAAAISLNEYWGLKHTPEFIDNEIRELLRTETMSTYESYFAKNGYDIETIRFTPETLKEQLRTGIPIFTTVGFDHFDLKTEPDLWDYTPVLIVGYREDTDSVIMQHFWFGPDYEMSFTLLAQQFEAIGDINYKGTIPGMVLTPTVADQATMVKNVTVLDDYPGRDPRRAKVENMLRNYALGLHSLALSPDEALVYFEAVRSDPLYDSEFPPLYKVYDLTFLAYAQFLLSDQDQAFATLDKAIELNNELNQPFGLWSGFALSKQKPQGASDQISAPYRILGHLYSRLSDKENAARNYEKALAINPNDRSAKFWLSVLNGETPPPAETINQLP